MISQLITVVFLLVVIASAYRLSLGFALVIACRLLIPPIVRVNLFVTELSLNSCLILLLMGMLMLKLRGQRIELPSRNDSKVFLRPFLVLLGSLAVVNIFGMHGGLSARFASFAQFIYTEFLLCFLGWAILKRREDIALFFRVVSMATVVIGLYGIFCYLTQSNPYITLVNSIYEPVRDALGFMEEERAGLTGRIQGTMTHPLIWGGSCMMLFMVFFVVDRHTDKYVRMVVLVLMAMNVVFSGSRSALLAMIIGIACVFYFGDLQVKRKFLVYSFIGAFLVALALYQVPTLSRYKDLFESTLFFWDEGQSENIKGSSVSMRLQQLEGAFNMIDGSGVFAGFGQGYIKYYSGTFGVHPILKGFESILFMALVESGILGLICWILFFTLLLKTIARINIPVSRKSQLYYIGSKAFVFVYLAFIVFTGLQSTLYLFLLLYLVLLKTSFSLSKNEPEDPSLVNNRAEQKIIIPRLQ